MAFARRHHQLVRFLAVAVTGVSLTTIAAQSRIGADITDEGLSRITPATLELAAGVEEARPVTIHAFVSRDVPREYVTVRSRLLNILHELEAKGGPGLEVRIVEPEPHSIEAEEAFEDYGISPQQLADRTGGRLRGLDVFLGVALVSGPRTQVIPFLDRGLSVEYELNRALRVVLQEKRKVVGILRTDATIMGNFDLQSRRRQAPWQIVEELRKQYEVRSLNPGSPIPDDVDVLLVPQLPSCTQEELDSIRAYVDAGRPALLTVDPAPLFDIRLAPRQPKPAPPGQDGMMGGAHGEPKGAYDAFLRDIGIDWADDRIVYDTVNPNPILGQTPPQIVFATDPEGGSKFGGDDPVLQGLTQIVLLYGGELKPTSEAKEHFHPLLSSSPQSGLYGFDDLYESHPLFGIMPNQSGRPPSPVTGTRHVLAARVDTKVGEGEAQKTRNVVVIADVDAIGDVFFSLNSRGGDIDGDGSDDVRFDNVPFLLNLVDSLAGDDRFFELRRRRPAYRRLERVDKLTEAAREERQKKVEEANARAEQELEKAKANLESAVATIRERSDLDETTKEVSLASVEAAENRRLQAVTATIEREKAREIERIDNKHGREVDEVQNELRLVAVLLPPLPALLLGAGIFARKRRRERETIPSSRRQGGAKPGPSPKAAKGGDA